MRLFSASPKGAAAKPAFEQYLFVGDFERQLPRPRLQAPRRFMVAFRPYPRTVADYRRELHHINRWVLDRLPHVPPHAHDVLSALLRHAAKRQVDLFHGSHFVVEDKGALYTRLMRKGTPRRRTSHYRDVRAKQYEINLGPLGSLLFGKDHAGHTWFQLESRGHQTAGLKDSLLHGRDWLLHKLSGNLNVGPLGLSPHSEKRAQLIRLTRDL